MILYSDKNDHFIKMSDDKFFMGKLISIYLIVHVIYLPTYATLQHTSVVSVFVLAFAQVRVKGCNYSPGNAHIVILILLLDVLFEAGLRGLR